MAGPPITRYERARTVIGRLLLWGVILLLVGYAIAVFNWPGEEIETFSDDVTQTGSQGAVAWGSSSPASVNSWPSSDSSDGVFGSEWKR